LPKNILDILYSWEISDGRSISAFGTLSGNGKTARQNDTPLFISYFFKKIKADSSFSLLYLIKYKKMDSAQ
jgi:hypothetical protein